MATLLTKIPGFGLTHAAEHAEAYRKGFIRALSLVFNQASIDAILKSPYVKLLPDADYFPPSARRLAYTGPIRLAVIYSCEDATLYVDASRCDMPGFAADFVAEFGISALYIDDSLETFNDLLYDDETLPNLQHDPIAVHCAIRFGLDNDDWNLSHSPLQRQVREFGHALLRGHVALPKPIDELTKEAIGFAQGETQGTPSTAHFWAYALHNIDSILLGKLRPIKDNDSLLRSDRKYPEPLCAVCTITTAKLPDTGILFGPSIAKELEHPTHEFLERFTWHLPNDDSQESKEEEGLYARSPTDLQPLRGCESTPLPNLTLCPLAEIQPRADRCLEGTADTPVLLRVWTCDLSTKAAEPIGFLPHIHTESTHYLRIHEAQVAPQLHWAILALKAVYTETPVFPAIFSGWALQADRLWTNTCYRTHLAFWCTDSCEARSSRNETAAWDGMDPCVHIDVVRVDRASFCNRGHSTRIAVLQCRIFDMQMPVFMLASRYYRLKNSKRMSWPLQGYFFVERFQTNNPVQEDIRGLLIPPIGLKDLRHLGQLARRNVDAALALAMHTPTKTSEQRRKRHTLLSRAKNAGLPEAIFLDAKDRMERLEPSSDDYFSAVFEVAEAASYGSFNALQALATDPIFEPWVASDLRDELQYVLATRFHQAYAQYAVSKRYASSALSSDPDSSSAILRFTWLLHSFLNGCDEGDYELIYLLTFGIGCAADPQLVEQILQGAAMRGLPEAQYWTAGLGRMGPDFFQASLSERLEAFMEGVPEGLPACVLALALFYEFDGAGLPQADLIAHGLYRWLEEVLGNPEVASLRERVEDSLEESDRQKIALFNPWEAIGCKRPTERLPLEKVTRSVEWLLVFSHTSFIRSLDPMMQEDHITDRLLKQIHFFAENSAVIPLGLAQDTHEAVGKRIRLTAYPTQEEASSMRLLIASRREREEEAWDIASIHPFFAEGTKVNITLHGALASESKASAVLHIRIDGPQTRSNLLLAFDPLWALAGRRYFTGEHYEAILYGFVCEMKLNASLFEGMPEPLLDRLRAKLKDMPLDAMQHKMVGFSACGNNEGLYQINTTVRSVKPEAATLGAISFVRLEVDPFFIHTEQRPTFTLYLDSKLHCPTRLPRVGERIDVIFELHAYPVRTTEQPTVVLN